MTSARIAGTSRSEFSRKWDLWWRFTVRTAEQRHRGSHLGFLWALLTPLLMLGLYFVVFSVIFGGRFGALADETPTDYAFAIFLGLILYQILAETLTVSPAIIVTNQSLVKKVVFPLEILPLAQLGASWFSTLVSLALLLIGSIVFGRGISLTALTWLPVILAPFVLVCVGLGWFFSALGVFFRDLSQVMPFIAQILLYASAVFYPISKIPPELWVFLEWNPLLHTIALARSAVLWNQPVDLKSLGYTYMVAALFFFGGKWTFFKLKSSFADVL